MTSREMRFRAELSDNVSKQVDKIAAKLGSLGVRAKAEQQKIDAEAKRTADKFIAEEERRQRERIRLQRNSIALEERMEKQRAAMAEQSSRATLQATQSRAAAQQRLERQAAQAESQLVLDKFERRIALERARHAHILTDLQRANMSVEAENRRHAAVISRIQMDQGNFANTPFQRMLQNFNKLNQGLSKFTPAINIAQTSVVNMSATMGIAAGASNAFGGALSSLAMGPVGIAVAAIAGLSAGLNLLIGRAEAAANLRESMGKGIQDPAKVQQLLTAMEKFEAAKGKRGAGAVNASKEVKAITGESAEDMQARGVNSAMLKRQLDALNKIKEHKRVHNEDSKKLDQDLANSRAALIEDETQRQLALERNRFEIQKRELAGHQENLVKAEQIHAANVKKIKKDAAQAQFDAEEEEKNRQLARDLEFKEARDQRARQLAEDKKRVKEDELRTEQIFAKRAADNEKALAEARKQAAFMAATNILQAGQLLFSQSRKNAVLLKTLAIGEIGVNTARAILGALAPPPSGLGPVKGMPLAVSIGVLGAAQALKASQQKFAMGGIVQGGPTSGDRIPIRANAGEMVLTREQQANLFSMAQGRGGGGGINAPITIHMSGSATQQDANRVADTVVDRMQILMEHARRTKDVANLGVTV